jgi:hypothetical protein
MKLEEMWTAREADVAGAIIPLVRPKSAVTQRAAAAIAISSWCATAMCSRQSLFRAIRAGSQQQPIDLVDLEVHRRGVGSGLI